MKFRHDFLVGFIFIAGMAIVGVFTIVVKDITILQGRNGKVSILFNRVDGLEEGHKVLASGMEVGTVSELSLQKNGKVKVDVNLTRPFKLFDGYNIKVKDASALGGKYIDISVGKEQGNGEEPLETKYEFPIQKAEAVVPVLPGEAKPSLLDNPDISDLVASLKRIAKDLEEGKGTIGLLIKERAVYDDLKEATKNLKELTKQLTNTKSTVGRLIYSDDLYNKIDKIVDDVGAITGKVRKGEGTIGRLVNDEKVYNDLEKMMAKADKVMSNLEVITDDIKNGKGTIGKLFTDEKVYNQLDSALTDARTMMNNINKTVNKISEGKGTLGALINDESMANNLKDTLKSLRTVATRLEKGEGTIGKLMADDELYKEIRRLVKNFSDSLEDTREQVPITTFTNILFKAF